MWRWSLSSLEAPLFWAPKGRKGVWGQNRHCILCYWPKGRLREKWIRQLRLPGVGAGKYIRFWNHKGKICTGTHNPQDMLTGGPLTLSPKYVVFFKAWKIGVETWKDGLGAACWPQDWSIATACLLPPLCEAGYCLESSLLSMLPRGSTSTGSPP